MGPKRHLGLAKAGKAKRLKTDSPAPGLQDASNSMSNTIDSSEPAALETINGSNTDASVSSKATNGAEESMSIELSDDVDVNDAMGQLKVLWRNFIASEERNELMVNAVVHECDRMLRKLDSMKEGKIDDEQIVLVGDFYGIYALALSSLAFFHTENPEQVIEYFKAAEDRIETGKNLYPESISILFAEARILINKIPLTEVSQLVIESRISANHIDAALLLDECLNKWEEAEAQSIERKEFYHFNRENSDFLEALDDLLEMVENFGQEKMEGEDSDAEDDLEEVVLNKKHPLYAIRKTDKYKVWWKEHTQKFLDNVTKNMQVSTSDEAEKKALVDLKKELSKRLGDSLLVEAEGPNSVFTTLAYFPSGKKEIDGLNLEQARELCKNLYGQALEYLKAAQDDDEPDSWASVAEATISLGNVYDVDSEEQEKLYKEAEVILRRANNVTNGKYESILENLIHG